MKTGHVYDEKQRGDRGALGGADRDRGRNLGGALVEEAARSIGQEGSCPRYQVRVDPFGLKHAAEGGGVDAIEAPLGCPGKA